MWSNVRDLAVWLLRQPTVLPDTDEENPVTEPQALPTLAEAVVPGDTIAFGHYEQENDATNGPEAITWKVLACESDTALLISERVLDYLPYDTNGSARWDTSSLRAELNGEFYDSAFFIACGAADAARYLLRFLQYYAQRQHRRK